MIQGKIYKITSEQTPKVYIGSTIKHYLSDRWGVHKCHYRYYKDGIKGFNKCASYDILKYPDAKIKLVMVYPCNDKKELQKKELEIIRETPNCCNLLMPTRTRKERHLENPEYYKKKKAEADKKYRETHKQQIKQRRSEFRKNNLDLVRERERESYQRNKAQKIAYQKERKKIKKYCNACKCEVQNDTFKRHERTQKHKKNILL